MFRFESDLHIAVVGLGYVGLPLAVEFSRKVRVTGFDVAPQRIAELKRGEDRTLEVSSEELKNAPSLDFTDDVTSLAGCDVFIVTVPTPINEHKQPDLGPLMRASKAIGSVMRSGSLVIYESTVYPGATEEICVPLLEEASGLRYREGFHCGYSPERINPGLIFDRLGIDTLEVLEAAGTKWNFLPFRPGLVGGHCISVDPYYLTHKAQEIGYHPQVILSGRQINDGMGEYIAGQVIKMLTRRRIHVAGSNVLVLGLAFKENCPDLRNTRVVDIVAELECYHARVEVHDPWVSASEAKAEYGIDTIETLVDGRYDAIILAVAHTQFRELGATRLRQLGKPEHVLYDIKGVLPRDAVDARL